MLQKYRDTETQIRNNQLNTGQFWGLGKGNTFKIQIHKSLRCVGVMCVCEGFSNFFSLLVFFCCIQTTKITKSCNVSPAW